jgi:hypothetical protein
MGCLDPGYQPKWRNFFRDQLLKGINAETGLAISPLFAEMAGEARKLTRIIDGAPRPPAGKPPAAPPAPNQWGPEPPSIATPFEEPAPGAETASRDVTPRLEDQGWISKLEEVKDPSRPLRVDEGPYDPREPWEMGMGGENFDQGHN